MRKGQHWTTRSRLAADVDPTHLRRWPTSLEDAADASAVVTELVLEPLVLELRAELSRRLDAAALVARACACGAAVDATLVGENGGAVVAEGDAGQLVLMPSRCMPRPVACAAVRVRNTRETPLAERFACG